jgi:hypothetical protein
VPKNHAPGASWAARMIERVNQIIADCANMSWHRSSLSLRRHFDYEYEDDKP